MRDIHRLCRQDSNIFVSYTYDLHMKHTENPYNTDLASGIPSARLS